MGSTGRDASPFGSSADHVTDDANGSDAPGNDAANEAGVISGPIAAHESQNPVRKRLGVMRVFSRFDGEVDRNRRPPVLDGIRIEFQEDELLLPPRMAGYASLAIPPPAITDHRSQITHHRSQGRARNGLQHGSRSDPNAGSLPRRSSIQARCTFLSCRAKMRSGVRGVQDRALAGVARVAAGPGLSRAAPSRQKQPQIRGVDAAPEPRDTGGARERTDLRHSRGSGNQCQVII